MARVCDNTLLFILYSIKKPFQLPPDLVIGQQVNPGLRHDYDIESGGKPLLMQAIKIPNYTFDPVPLDGLAHLFAYGDAKSSFSWEIPAC